MDVNAEVWSYITLDLQNDLLYRLSQSPAHSVQLALAPEGTITEESAAAAGLDYVADTLAMNLAKPIEGTLALVGDVGTGTPAEIELITPVE